MAYLNFSQLLAYPSGLWESLIAWFEGFITNYGWTIIIFTILLKIVLLPLDIMQKRITKTSTEKQAAMQPKIAKLQSQYGNNKELLNQKTMQLYKSENYNVMGTCFGMLINIVLTLVIFITLFNGLRNISQYKIAEQYSNLKAEYSNAYVLAMQGVEDNETNRNSAHLIAKQSALEKYTEIKDSWLWISNIWIADTSASKFPTFEEYLTLSNTNYNKEITLTAAERTSLGLNETDKVYYITIDNTPILSSENAKTSAKADYELVATDILSSYSGWNGYYILVVLAGLITWLSQFITKKSTPQPQTVKLKDGTEVKAPSTGKILMYVLPAIMVIFTLQTSAAFSLYIVTNSIISTIFTYLLGIIMTKIDDKKKLKSNNAVAYSRDNVITVKAEKTSFQKDYEKEQNQMKKKNKKER